MDNYWYESNFSLIDGRSQFRADKWNGVWWGVGGVAVAPGATLNTIATLNVTNASSVLKDFTLPYSARGVGQCPYNQETFIAFGGTNNEDSQTYDMFHIIGANLFEYCGGNNDNNENMNQTARSPCSINCTNVLTCTDRDIFVDPYSIKQVDLNTGSLSGYGLTIQLEYNYSYNYNTINTNNTTSTTATTAQLAEFIDINIHALNKDGNGFSAGDMLLYYFDKSVTIPANINFNCETQGSCLDGTFELYAGSNISMICQGNNTCSGTQFTTTLFDYTNVSKLGNWTLIDTVDLICSGENSCQAILFNVTSMIVGNLTVSCIGNNSCAGMELRSLRFDISCIGENSCESALFHGANTEILSAYQNQTGIVDCGGTQSCTNVAMINMQSHSLVDIACNGDYSCNDIIFHQNTNNTIVDNQEYFALIVNYKQIMKIDCTGSESCHNMTVFCPIIVPDKGKNSQCIVNLNNYITNGDIYATSGTEYINLNCSNNEFDPTWFVFNQTIGNETVRTSQDFGVCDNVIIHCGWSYNYKCHMEYVLHESSNPDGDINGSYSWICNGNCSTFAATLAPTNSPNNYPSVTPSDFPTEIPVTIIPSQTPSTIPSGMPTVIPTQAPSEYTFVSEAEISFYFNVILVVVSVVMILTIGFGLIDAKTKRKNELFSWTAIVCFSFYANDFLSDVFFAMKLYVLAFDGYGENDRYFLISFILACVFVLLPLVTNIWQLQSQLTKWTNDPILNKTGVSKWIQTNVKSMYLISVFSGSCFSAIALCNSYLLQLSVCSMGLSHYHQSIFWKKRFVCVVLLEAKFCLLNLCHTKKLLYMLYNCNILVVNCIVGGVPEYSSIMHSNFNIITISQRRFRFIIDNFIDDFYFDFNSFERI